MYPSPFRYYRARTLSEAVTQLVKCGEDARVLAGGQSLIPAMKTRLAAPAELVDIGFVPSLSYMTRDKEYLHIGALVRHRDVELAPAERGLEILQDAAGVIADVQVRNRGTICGSLVYADPAGDWAPVMLALGAELEIHGHGGPRTIPVREFFLDLFTTALRTGEIVRELRVPMQGPQRTSAYLALKRRAGDFAIASVALSLNLDTSGICTRAGVALGNAAQMPLIAREAERALIGRDPADVDVVAEVADAAMNAAVALADGGSAGYKREVVAALTRRALDIAVKRHRGETIFPHNYV